ncbi:uncharacterized protein LOC100647558 [Bombus terrestris]|uniref:Uncharacterized protein LOC100647558 n=1 Tax=Bombus terrestris TaxID=30195 RepID=A0A9B0C213_BOMTE|nr:uncharacterized protein LOC100647558 [Bombus terrestris]
MPRKKQGRGKTKKEKKEVNEDKEKQYFEEIIDVDENTTKNFEFLSNAPISKNDDFVFQSEKNWDVDVFKYSEFFTVDLKTLSAAIETISFNENVNIDAKYFTDDQLTDIYNTVERGKEKYNKILSDSEEMIVNNTRDEDKNQDSSENTADDLDFLLSCREPVTDPLTIVKSISLSSSSDSKITNKPNTSTKSLDLEKWLDSILDD